MGKRPYTRPEKGKNLLHFPRDYVVIDIETTGLDARIDELIELGAIRISDGTEVETFQSLVKPQEAIPAFITELTGITNEMVADVPDVDAVLPLFLAFISDSVLVGHNIHFDINFLYDEAENIGCSGVCNDFVDTLRLARLLFPDLENHKLPTVAACCGLPDNGGHRARKDCTVTYRCLEYMRAYCEEENILDLAVFYAKPLTPNSVRPTTSYIDPDNPIFGKHFAFTGQFELFSQEDAAQLVVDCGGIYERVKRSTDYLVVGDGSYQIERYGKPSRQHMTAQRYMLEGKDIAIISEEIFIEMFLPSDQLGAPDDDKMADFVKFLAFGVEPRDY